MKIPRIMLCAGASNSGKTLITCGVLQAMKNRGLNLASFKCGPDYIDPMFHTRVIGTKACNLDTFFTNHETVRHLLAENARTADLAVIEGVMGYYDGIGGYKTEASTYDVARATSTPAILVVNCKGMSLSAAAYVRGFVDFMKDSNIKGVILNRISPMVYDKVKPAIEENCSVRVIGYVPQVDDCVIESRHLGLMMPGEISQLREKLMKLAEVLEKTLDIDLLLEIAGQAPEIKDTWQAGFKKYQDDKPVKIAVARDEAFCFMYEDNLNLLTEMGAEICQFSPINDELLPDGVAGLILYGGYPELYADRLANNQSMMADIRKKCGAGMPLLAECGGFMYLHEEMEDMDGTVHRGAGLIKGRAYKTNKLGRFGYINLTCGENPFFGGNSTEMESFPAHEFHYFDSTDPGESFTAQKPASSRSWKCIHSTETMLAGFPHFYYYGNPAIAQVFLEKCRQYTEKMEK